MTTATFGTYEKTLKQPLHCTVPFIAYSDQLHLRASSSCWQVVTTPHHLWLDPTLWQRNSIASHTSAFNLAKFYKLNLHRLPELRGYEFVLWMDTSIRLKADLPSLLPRFREHVCWALLFENLPFLGGRMSSEVKLTINTTKYYTNATQEPQDVEAQYQRYVDAGFREHWWRVKGVSGGSSGGGSSADGSSTISLRQPGRESPHAGVWVTAFVLWRMSNPWVPLFLDSWWFQNAHTSTQDQVSFPFVAWRLSMLPYTLPDGLITRHRDKFVRTALYDKLSHGK